MYSKKKTHSQTYVKEIIGRLFAVGDLHGCYDLLIKTLDEIGFDYEKDLLVCTGDLVDRGTQNIECVNLIDEPWFLSVKGNHDELCIKGAIDVSHLRCHLMNGGEWLYDLPSYTQKVIRDKLDELPHALEIEYRGRTYGFVHGHVEEDNWEQFKSNLDSPIVGVGNRARALWNRTRIHYNNGTYGDVKGVDAVILGHTVVKQPTRIDNCFYIDTGAVYNGKLDIIDLDTIFDPDSVFNTTEHVFKYSL